MDVKKMDLLEKVGQLFVFGFPGKEITPFIKNQIVEKNLGGIVHFSRNVESPAQVHALNKSLQELAKKSSSGIPLFIAVDQEGGTVVRLHGAAVAPSAMALGAADEEEGAERVCSVAALELRATGFNMNLAPVVDVNNNPHNPVIGIRSFGEDPKRVAALGRASIRGYQRHVAAVAKHFPGHGDTSMDSHLALPVIAHDTDRLQEVELLPFCEAIKENVAGIMTAHVCFPAYEERKNLPGTLSYRVLTKLLREELGYEGLIMTDCMEMMAISETYGTVEAAIMTLEAGADLVLISHSDTLQGPALEAVAQAVKEGRLTEERIDASVKRILKAKEALGLWEEEKRAPSFCLVGSPAHKEVMKEAIRKSITVVQGEEYLPLEGKIFVMEPENTAANIAEDVFGETGTLASALKAQAKQEVVAKALTSSMTKEEQRALMEEAKGYSHVILVTQDGHRNPSQSEIVKEVLSLGLRPIVIGSRTPYELMEYKGVPTYIAAYGNHPFVWEAVAQVLLGTVKAEGRLPVSIP